MLSIHQVLTSFNGITGYVTFDSQEGTQIREWLQELLNLREQMKALKKRFPSLIDNAEPPYGMFLQAPPNGFQSHSEYEKDNLEQEHEPLIQEMDAANKNLLARIDELEEKNAKCVTEIGALRYQIKTLQHQLGVKNDLVQKRDSTITELSNQIHDLKIQLQDKCNQIAEYQSELEHARAVAADRTEDNKRLAGMQETANTDRQGLSQEIERLGREREASIWTKPLTPLHQVFQEQAKSRGVELIDSQVIMLVWLLENTPNERQRTAYVCNNCGTPMVSRGGGEIANRCSCPNGVSRTTVGVF